MKRIITKPKNIIAFFAALLFFNFIIYSQSVQPAAAKNSMLDGISQTFSFISNLITSVGLVTVIVWYFWKGKNLEQLNKNVAELKDALDIQEKKNARLKLDIAAKDTRIAQLVETLIKMKKANLKLQGLSEAEIALELKRQDEF